MSTLGNALCQRAWNSPQRRLARYAWGVLGFNVLVILWGAFVRATGSGAGCGSHWPSCRDQVLPLSGSVETLIELAHRATSGLALLLVLGLVVWSWRACGRGHPVRRGAAWSLVFILVEALVGAGLVWFELVAQNASVARAVVIALHLVNTLLLLAALCLTAWWAGGGGVLRLRGQARAVLAGLGVTAALLLLLGMSGAVTALGDTLFPPDSLHGGLRADFSATAHFLVGLRVWHPLLAVLSGAVVFFVALHLGRRGPSVRRWALALSGLFSLQLVLGALNLLWLVPIGLQLVHLFVADAVWVAFVLFAAASLEGAG